MNKKQFTFYSIGGLIFGVIGGIAGTAFSMGASRQRVNDTLIRHTAEIMSVEMNDEKHEETVQKELDRFSKIISSQMTSLQNNITRLSDTIGNLRTDVQVLKALMQRMENDFRANSD